MTTVTEKKAEYIKCMKRAREIINELPLDEVIDLCFDMGLMGERP